MKNFFKYSAYISATELLCSIHPLIYLVLVFSNSYTYSFYVDLLDLFLVIILKELIISIIIITTTTTFLLLL